MDFKNPSWNLARIMPKVRLSVNILIKIVEICKYLHILYMNYFYYLLLRFIDIIFYFVF